MILSNAIRKLVGKLTGETGYRWLAAGGGGGVGEWVEFEDGVV